MGMQTNGTDTQADLIALKSGAYRCGGGISTPWALDMTKIPNIQVSLYSLFWDNIVLKD